MREQSSSSEEGSAYAFRLSFMQVECVRCSATRIRGIPCPICGMRPADHDVDPERQRRQRVARQMLDHLHQPLQPSDPNQAHLADETFAQLGELIPSFLASLQTFVVDSADSGESISSTIRQLRAVRTALQQTPTRPKILRHKVARRAAELVTDAMSGWLTAIAAEDPLTAQRASEEAQRSLDSAGNATDELSRAMEAWERVEEVERVEDILGRLHIEAVTAGGHENLLGLERAGAADFSNLTGEECPAGIGTAFRVTEVVAGFVLNADRYRSVIQTSVELLLRDPAKLEPLLNSPSLATDLLEGEVHGALAWLTAQAVWATSRTDEHSLRELVRLSGELVEGAGKRYVAALTSITRPQRYEERRRLLAGQLVREALADGLGHLVEGFDIVLRNAASHVDYLIEDDTVVLTDHGEVPTTPRRLKSDELIDEVLKSAESCMALGIAMGAVAGINDRSLLDGNRFLMRLGA